MCVPAQQHQYHRHLIIFARYIFHSFSSRYFLVVFKVFIAFTTHYISSNMHVEGSVEMKKKQIFLCNNILNVVQLLKEEQKKYANIITSWIESSVEKRFKDDDNDECCCFFVYFFVLHISCVCMLLLVYTKLNNVLGCCVPRNKRLLLSSLLKHIPFTINIYKNLYENSHKYIVLTIKIKKVG